MHKTLYPQKQNFQDNSFMNWYQFCDNFRETHHMTSVNIKQYDEFCFQHAGVELASYITTYIVDIIVIYLQL